MKRAYTLVICLLIGISFLVLLYLQGKYATAMVRMRQEQFDENMAALTEIKTEKFANYKTAYALALKFYALKDIRTYSILSEERKEELKVAYETAKTALSAISNKSAIRELISDNTNYYYQQAEKKFTATTEE